MLYEKNCLGGVPTLEKLLKRKRHFSFQILSKEVLHLPGEREVCFLRKEHLKKTQMIQDLIITEHKRYVVFQSARERAKMESIR